MTPSLKRTQKDSEIEESLRQSEELHRIILTNISDSVFLTDPDGDFTFICPNVDIIFGYTFDEIFGMKNISVLIGDGVYDLGSLDAVSEIRNVEREVRDKNGSSHTVLINIKKVDIKYGKLLFTCRDITEYRRVKQELAKNISDRKQIEKDLTIFFNLSADLFCITEGSHFKNMNPAWKATLGYSPDELKGKTVYDFIHPDDVDLTRSLNKRMTAGRMLRYENRYRHKDGTYKWMSWNCTMSDMGLLHKVGRDITQKKKEEFEIKRRLMRYKLELGRTYLVCEPSTTKLVESFRELLGINYPGLIISRRDRSAFDPAISETFKYFWLSDRAGTDTIDPDLENIEKNLESLESEHAIIVDGLDYLIRKFGPKKVISFVGHLREIAFFKNHTILVNLDPASIDQRDLVALEKEAPPLETYPRTDLSDEMLEVLKNTYEYNCIGKRPTRTDLCKKIGISYPTLHRRINDLIAVGYLCEARSGSTVRVEVTERGRNAILK